MTNSTLAYVIAAGLAVPALFGQPLTPVPFRDVKIRDAFWTPWMELNRRVIVPHNFRLIEETGVLENFDKAAALKPAQFEGFHNADEILYKAVEAASFLLAERPDAKLDAFLDDVIRRVAAAQEPSGYLCTPGTIGRRAGQAPGRFGDGRLVYEMYLFGHLYEAAVAHYHATGKRTLLDVALRNADFLDSVIGPDKLREVPQHPNIEQALVKLFEATGEKRYLALTRFLIDERGRSNGRKLHGSFAQDHVPIVDQTEALGQAPRATYLYSGVADVLRHQPNARYMSAMEKLWENVAFRKMYVTGGIGSRHENEGFGPDYDLPNDTAYTETCAAVSWSMWNHRMFLLTGDARYMDVLERTIYNNFLAGTSMRGNAFFYANPLESDGKWAFNRGWAPKNATGPYLKASTTRKKWFYCACCPPNVARQIPWTGTYVYAKRDDDIWVNLFVAGEAKIGDVHVLQQTNYPWNGKVKLTIRPEKQKMFSLRLRVPGWAVGRPVPGDLYRYIDARAGEIVFRVNGRVAQATSEKGYAVLTREWKAGDVVSFEFPMPVRRVVSHPAIEANNGKVAIERGPMVYCVEGADNGGSVQDLRLPDDAPLQPSFRKDLLGGVVAIRSTAHTSLTAIPYYAWANRGPGEMQVWLTRRTGAAVSSE